MEGKVIIVKLLFFGATADALGSRELELATDNNATVESLIGQLSTDHPAIANQKLLVAVNEEYAAADTLLSDGDEVAIFTAVSGG